MPAFLKSTLATALVLLCAVPSFAKDPFRRSNQKPIGDKTEAIFHALFKEGDHKKATNLLGEAESKEGNEPLLYALKASIARNQGDETTFRAAASKTRETAEALVKSDPLRGNLYIAMGNFLESAAIIQEKGVVRGTPSALGKLQDAFAKLDEAEKIDAQDPELNLLKGTMDLMLAVNINLPFSDADKAIKRLEGAAAPRYIADRNLAWAYRDMKKQDQAMIAVDRALQDSPNNPELSYLKAQILVRQDRNADALKLFDKALERKGQLPDLLGNQIQRERDRTEKRMANRKK
jgi:tetratricopeptide (TPR) repeat protein